MKSSPAALPTLLILALCCSTERQDVGNDNLVAPLLWQLSEEPLMEIGVQEGNPTYELHTATSSFRAADGRIIVGNTGSQEVRVFDARGRHLWTAGGSGRGPGEFRWLSRVYRLPADSIMALDMAGNRLSVFDGNGEFARLFDVDRSVDPDFPLDVWLYQQYWVEGAIETARKGLVKGALDRMPLPSGEPAYRFARVDSENNIWVRDPRSPDTNQRWSVFDTFARLIAVIETPQRFDLHDIGPDFVLGRWQDQNDVNFIRLYGLAKTSHRVPRHWAADVASHPNTGQGSAPSDEDELVEVMRNAMRNLVMAQEIYFADSMQYSA